MNLIKLKLIQKALIRPAYNRADMLGLLTSFSNDDTSVDSLLATLCTKQILKEFCFELPNRTHTVYAPPKTPLEVVLMGIHPQIHLSHATAMELHQLSEKPLDRIYVNVEQQAGSPTNAILIQGRIDAAFKQSPRASNNIAKFEKNEICLLAGKNTGYLDVQNFQVEEDHTVRATSIERTLIDVVTRPIYAGGVEAVLLAFQKAQGRVSTKKLATILKVVGHVYPYHQCIGFFLEQAGNYSKLELAPFRKLPQEFDFYLTNQITDARFVPSWRLYVPASFTYGKAS